MSVPGVLGEWWDLTRYTAAWEIDHHGGAFVSLLAAVGLVFALSYLRHLRRMRKG